MSDGSNGRILGTIAGAALAYFTGGASVVALGATLGGAVGSLLDPKAKIEGPRLDDLKVQFSSYGVGIPRIYGTERVGGNVIWSTDKLEIASVTSSGKGGGGTENTSYKYYVHMSLLLCETPRDGSTVSIVKFFQDGKLIWDASSGIPIGSALASAENPYSSFVLFQGHQDQLPDPIEESWTGGPGSCSAYRGVVRARLIAVECPGGREPQFSFVLSTGATVGEVQEEFLAGVDDRIAAQSFIGLIGATEVVHAKVDNLGFGWPRYANVSFGMPDSLVKIARYQLQPGFDQSIVGPSNAIPVVGGDPAFVQILYATSADRTADIVTCYRIDAKTGAAASLGQFPLVGDTVSSYGFACYDEFTGTMYVIPKEGSASTGFVALKNNAGTALPKPSAGWGATAAYAGELHMMNSLGTAVTRLDGEMGAEIDNFTLTGALTSPVARAMLANKHGVFALSVGAGAGTTRGIWKRGASAYSLVTSNVVPGVQSAQEYRTFYACDDYAIVGPSIAAGAFAYTMIRFNATTTHPYKVKDIIAAECELAGVATYDVSGIPDSDTVIGYKLANPASARANIEPLLTLIGGYVVDEDGVTKFKKFADITSVASISFDELGQAEGDASGEAMPLNRTQEIDLPRSVTTSYIDPSNDYQTAAETELRQVTDATEDAQIQLPVCVTSDQARKVSQMALYDRWRRQNSRSTTVSRKFAFVSPGDGVTVEYPRGTFRLWLVLSTNDTGALCEWSLCPGDASIFAQTAVGATGYISQSVVPLAAPTNAQILDMAITRDVDNNAGVYVALDSYGAEPANAELFIGADDSALETRGAVSASAPIGYAEGAIVGAPSSLIDEANLLTVNLGDDVFTSCTRDVLLAGGGEYWAYGQPGRWEIGASALGTSLGSGRYTLSRHLRGQFGTEQYASAHVEGDRFVLLRSAGMLRPNMSVGEIGQTKSYRAVSKGRSRDSAASQTYANTGEGLKPLAPINLRRTQVSNDITLTWDRRSRLAMNNSTGVVPLGEAVELYTVGFYTNGSYSTLAGTLTTATASLTITGAQQTDFGLTPGDQVYVKVRQVSDSIGPGAELTGSGDGRIPHKYWSILCLGTPPSNFSIGELILRAVVGGASIGGGGTAFASSTYIGYSAANAFDGNAASYWVSTSPNARLGVQFDVPVSLAQYGMQTTSFFAQTPTAWLLQFSDDGVTWITADAQSGITWTAAAQYFSL